MSPLAYSWARRQPWQQDPNRFGRRFGDAPEMAAAVGFLAAASQRISAGTLVLRFAGRHLYPAAFRIDERRLRRASGSATRSSLRELTPSFVNTFRRCHSTVRGLRNSCAPISGFVRTSAASRAIWASCAVSSARVSTVRLRTVSPVAASSRRVCSELSLLYRRDTQRDGAILGRALRHEGEIAFG